MRACVRVLACVRACVCVLKNDKRLALRLDSSGPIPPTPTGIADVTMSSIALGCLLSELKADPNTIIMYVW